MFNNINDEELDVYEKIGQKIKIRKEIESIDEKIEVLKVKEDIEQISLVEDIKKLSERRDLLLEEESENQTGNSEEYALIIGKLDAIKDLKKKLHKLEEKKSSISEKIYGKLKQEYDDEYKKNESILLNETDKIIKVKNEVEEFLKNVNVLREEEEVRFNLNEYSEQEYNELIEKIDKNEKKAEAIQYATTVLLEEFQNELK